ncbi:hypothetical protein NIES4072_31320 [Nostoc commune NIES-4072]|uniref:Uncharacterized protein n=1 Tax=Nostoc commune NIES-4072 TaxID=2005467 RepID=A0A2R5FUV4_NOSCO|nr:hypothetical protein [Nostoc commune]BBD69535.1 hypothetical protein NIES4070_59440 [Nostoc commune HK-02]GBG19464.1 hypothetical protein NIES4072_31320 [Nostoc commune NIES-4072]
MDEISILRSLASTNRSIYQSKLVSAQKASSRILENSVKILNYDADLGQYKVKNTAGQIFSARAISNGVFAIGDQVSLVAPIGGIPIIDAMPR